MSYCRFSSDDWKCDVYVYESDAGYVVHIASSRFTAAIPSIPDILKVSNDEWFSAYKKQMETIHGSPRQPIGEALDGESFTYLSLTDLLAGLREIAAYGYRVPEFVFSDIENEILEAEGNR